MGLSSVNMGALLAKKYAILQQEADARTTEANARVVGAQRPLVPDNGMGGGGGGGIDIPDPAQAELDRQLRQAQIGAANAEAKKANVDANITESGYYDNKRAANFGFNSGTPSDFQARLQAGMADGLTGEELYKYAMGKLKRGLTKVPGKGTKDKVPVLLAPGEAVLNANAAKKLGRGLIAHLNAYGNAKAAKKGMV